MRQLSIGTLAVVGGICICYARECALGMRGCCSARASGRLKDSHAFLSIGSLQPSGSDWIALEKTRIGSLSRTHGNSVWIRLYVASGDPDFVCGKVTYAANEPALTFACASLDSSPRR